MKYTKTKQILLIITALFGIVILSGCIEETKPASEPNNLQNQLQNQTEIEETEKIINNTYYKYNVSSLGDLKKNSNIKFKKGDLFTYQYMSGHNSTFSVTGIERIDGHDCYTVFNKYKVTSYGEHESSHTATYYYDKTDGKVLKVKVDGSVVADGAENLRATDLSFFAYWMLGLTDDAKWDISFIEVTPSLNRSEHAKFEFQVVGREKVNNRECFKVEKRAIDEDNKIVEEIDYYWVDVEKRILVRSEFHSDNVKLTEVNLVSGL